MLLMQQRFSESQRGREKKILEMTKQKRQRQNERRVQAEVSSNEVAIFEFSNPNKIQIQIHPHRLPAMNTTLRGRTSTTRTTTKTNHQGMTFSTRGRF